jgi:hypothetical protein
MTIQGKMVAYQRDVILDKLTDSLPMSPHQMTRLIIPEPMSMMDQDAVSPHLYSLIEEVVPKADTSQYLSYILPSIYQQSITDVILVGTIVLEQ